MTRPKRVLMFLVDGFDPGYVQPARMPRLAALMKAGASTLDGRGVLPSLTNVNHISLVTGTYPARHGLSTNFFVVQAQRDLATAQNSELRALLNYRKAVVDYGRSQEAPAARVGRWYSAQLRAQGTFAPLGTTTREPASF